MQMHMHMHMHTIRYECQAALVTAVSATLWLCLSVAICSTPLHSLSVTDAIAVVVAPTVHLLRGSSTQGQQQPQEQNSASRSNTRHGTGVLATAVLHYQTAAGSRTCSCRLPPRQTSTRQQGRVPLVLVFSGSIRQAPLQGEQGSKDTHTFGES